MAIHHPSLIGRLRHFLSKFIRQGPKPLSEFDQTRLSWARVAENPDEIPETFKTLFDSLPLPPGAPFSYTVITPTFRGFLQEESEKLICRIGDILYVLELSGGRPVSIGYPLEEISYLETGTVLLSSWFTVQGRDLHGDMRSSTLRFNAITEHMLTPFVSAFRAAVTGTAGNLAEEDEGDIFLALADQNFKFMNYARRSLLAGETIAQFLLQPEIRDEILRLFGFSLSRYVAPAHLAILTDSELILIRDDETQRKTAQKAYGGIWNYIPVKKIESISFSAGHDDRLTLSIGLPGNIRFTTLYTEDRKPELERFYRQVKAGIS
jgi:hypothetical protein